MFSLIVTFILQKLRTKLKILKHSSRTITLSKDTIFGKKNTDISKIRRVLVLQGIFSETRYSCVKFEVSSIILKSLRQGDNFTPPPPQNKPVKSPPVLGLPT